MLKSVNWSGQKSNWTSIFSMEKFHIYIFCYYCMLASKKKKSVYIDFFISSSVLITLFIIVISELLTM